MKYQTYCRPAPPPDDASVYSLDYPGDYATLGNVPDQTYPSIPYVPYGVAGDVMPERPPPMECCVTPDAYPSLQTWGWPVAPPTLPSYGDDPRTPEQVQSDQPKRARRKGRFARFGGVDPDVWGQCPEGYVIDWSRTPVVCVKGPESPGAQGASGQMPPPQSGPRLVARKAHPWRRRRKGRFARFGVEGEPGMGKEMVISALLGAAVVLWWRS